MIITMDEENYQDIMRMAPDDAARKRVVRMSKYLKLYPTHITEEPGILSWHST